MSMTHSLILNCIGVRCIIQKNCRGAARLRGSITSTLTPDVDYATVGSNVSI